MMPKPLAAPVAVLLAFVTFAGCTNPPLAPSDSQPTASLPFPSTTPPFPTDLPPVNTSVPFYIYSNCTEILMPFDGPRDTGRAVVPDAFQPWGADTEFNYHYLVIAKECLRSLDNRTVFGAVSEYVAVAFAKPVNESWREDRFYDYYVLDYYTTSEPLRKSIAQLGVSLGISTIQITKTSVSNQQVWNWKLETSGFGARFGHRMHSEDPQYGDFRVHLWFGTGPFRRVDAIVRYEVDSLLNEGELVLDGDSRLEKALVVPGGAHVGTSHVNLNWTYEIDSGFFGKVKGV